MSSRGVGWISITTYCLCKCTGEPLSAAAEQIEARDGNGAPVTLWRSVLSQERLRGIIAGHAVDATAGWRCGGTEVKPR